MLQNFPNHFFKNQRSQVGVRKKFQHPLYTLRIKSVCCIIFPTSCFNLQNQMWLFQKNANIPFQPLQSNVVIPKTSPKPASPHLDWVSTSRCPMFFCKTHVFQLLLQRRIIQACIFDLRAKNATFCRDTVGFDPTLKSTYFSCVTLFCVPQASQSFKGVR